MPRTPPHFKLYNDILQAASEHAAQSDPDMEVGDLQTALALALKYVPAVRLTNLRRELAEILAWNNP